MDLWRLRILLLASVSRAESGDANYSFRLLLSLTASQFRLRR